MDIVDRLKSSHSLLGDPLHRDAWEEIEGLRADVKFLLVLLELKDEDDAARANDTAGHPEGTGKGALSD